MSDAVVKIRFLHDLTTYEKKIILFGNKVMFHLAQMGLAEIVNDKIDIEIEKHRVG